MAFSVVLLYQSQAGREWDMMELGQFSLLIYVNYERESCCRVLRFLQMNWWAKKTES